jgi:hypothetical protein
MELAEGFTLDVPGEKALTREEGLPGVLLRAI